MAKTTVPVINDAYVGKVFGNVLDHYDNPSYNIKLYMVRHEYSKAFTESKDQFYAKDRVAPEADTVILAQTGVTANQIDDVTIQSLSGAEGGSQNSMDFTIIQPGAATFLDEIQYAKGYLGLEGSDTTMFLEIRFQGYTTDFEDNEEGGEPTNILGPLVYKIKLTEFDLSLDEAGSVYNCRSLIFGTAAYRDAVFRSPQTLTTTGATITEHVRDFEAALNEWHTNTTAHTIPDQIEINLEKLFEASNDGTTSLTSIRDENLLTSKDTGQAESVNRIMNETWEVRTKLEQQTALAEAPVDTGIAPEIQFDGDNLSIKEGTTIEEFMYIILSMCPEFYSKISRKENIDDPESPIKKDQGFIAWFKIHATSEELEFDPSRNKYASKYVYTPILYRTANPNIAVDIAELNPEIADIKERVKQFKANGSLKKAYSYIFTGLNDQIMSLDIGYNGAVASMLAPKYGAIGEISQTSQNKISDSTPEGEDTSYAGRLDSLIGKAKDKADKDIFGGFVDAVNDLQNGTDAILNDLANQLSNASGLNEADILNLIQDKAGINSLVESLDREVRSQLGGLQINVAPPATEPPEIIVPSTTPGGYNPESSGFVYSADFITPSSDQELDAATLAELGYVQANDFKNITQAAEASKDVKSDAEAGTTQTGTTRNKLFGFITEQHNAATFLVSLDMEVRGDPWYLSPADLSDTTDAVGNFNRDQQLFFLRIASPQKFDPDWRDEDANSGYWKFDGTSRTFSGVYRIVSVTNSFSSGIFTTALTAQRVSALDEPIDIEADDP